MYYAAQTEPEKPSGLTVEYDQERGKVCITAPGCTVTYDSSTGNVEISGLGMVEYQNEKVTIGG